MEDLYVIIFFAIIITIIIVAGIAWEVGKIIAVWKFIFM